MNLLKNLKRVALALVLTLMFANSTQANNANVVIENNTIEIEYTVADSSLDAEMDTLFMSLDLDCEEFKDGKWKKRLKELWDGILDGFTDGFGSMSDGGGNGGMTADDLQYLETFATETIQNRANALELIYKMEELVEDESNLTSEDQLRSAFNNDAQMVQIFKNAYENGDDVFPLDKDNDVAGKKSPWYKVGYIIGRLLHLLLP